MLTLVTVTYQDPTPTLRLIEDLRAQTSQNFTLIVVDNKSDPHYRETLRKAIATVTYSCIPLWNETNKGFAGGTNTGIAYAQAHNASWVLIINNDTRVAPTFIADLLQRLKTQPPGLIGLPLIEHGVRIVSGTVAWLTMKLTHNTQKPTNNSYIIGAAMVIDRETLQSLGPLDERYFLYFEDTEYTLRARSLRLRIDFLSSPELVHTPSQSTSKLSSPLLLQYHARNAILLNQTHGPWWIRALTPLWAVSVIGRNVVKYLCIPSVRPQARALIRGAWDGLTHRYGIIQ